MSPQAYRNNASIPRFRPRPPDADDGWRMQQFEIDRAQEMRKCIECFLCQDVCHVLRSHRKHEEFIGPTYLVRTAGYSLNPIDVEDRSAFLKESGGIGFCNITKCCTEVCPEHITITDNAIIPPQGARGRPLLRPGQGARAARTEKAGVRRLAKVLDVQHVHARDPAQSRP